MTLGINKAAAKKYKNLLKYEENSINTDSLSKNLTAYIAMPKKYIYCIVLSLNTFLILSNNMPINYTTLRKFNYLSNIVRFVYYANGPPNVFHLTNLSMINMPSHGDSKFSILPQFGNLTAPFSAAFIANAVALLPSAANPIV